MMLRLIDPPRYDPRIDLTRGGVDWWHAGTYPYEVGDCWYATPDGDPADVAGVAWCTFPDGPAGEPVRPIHVSDFHRRPGVVPMLVVLPGTAGIHCLQTSPSSEPGGGWTVAGELPHVTVHPSIDVCERWHGHIVGGELRTC